MKWHKTGIALAVMMTLAGVAAGQQARETLTGMVVEAASQAPIAGARVTVDSNSSVEALTDAAGRFRLVGATRPVTLTVRRIGYRQASQVVSPGGGEVRVMLTAQAVSLDEIVVTGTPGAAEKRSIGNSVATIRAADIQQLAGAADATRLINGKAAGVIVVPGTGQVGSGPRIRIRNAPSLSLSDQPLVYIDGVRMDNDVAVGPNSQGTSAVISRLSDMNPDDIENIEIIKGPAAATLYGTEASNGVIQIITKKGHEGRPTVTFNSRQGTNWFMNPGGRIPKSYALDPTTSQLLTWDPVAAEKARGTPLFLNGRMQHYDLAVNGGSAATRYFVATGYDRERGIESNNRLWKFNSRMNLSFQPTSTLDANFNLAFIGSRTDLPQEGSSGNGVIVNAAFGSPLFLNTPKRGFLVAPPEILHEAGRQTYERLQRFTQGLQINHHPWGWLNQKLTLGLDLTGEDDEALTQRADSDIAFFSATAVLGQKNVTIHNVLYATVDYSGTVKAKLGSRLVSSASVGAQYYRRRDQRITATGRQFPATDLQTIAATAITTGSEDFFENSTLGMFVQEQMAWRNVAFLTGAVRVDNNSAFGPNVAFITYPKVSGTWVLSDEPFWHVPVANALKLRAAYGQSGQQPQSFAALKTYAPVTTGAGGSGVTPQFVGNPDLAPERAGELEAGLEAGLFKDRIGLDFTYYNRRIRRAILQRATAPSLGFPGIQYVNAGAVENHGVELQLRALALSTSKMSWDWTVNISRNGNKVVDLGGDQFFYVTEPGTGFITPLNSQRHQVGMPLGAWFGKEVVSATVPANGIATNLMCNPGNGGAPMPCDQAPIIYLGRPDPNFEGGISSTLTFLNRFKLYALLDFKAGNKIFNNTSGFRCQTRNSCFENVQPLSADPVDVAVAQSNRVYWNTYLQDASFAKLREVTVSYTLPEGWARRFGATGARVSVSGRNLHTFTKYPGIDPELSFLVDQFTRTEQTNTPPLAQLSVAATLTF